MKTRAILTFIPVIGSVETFEVENVKSASAPSVLRKYADTVIYHTKNFGDLECDVLDAATGEVLNSARISSLNPFASKCMLRGFEPLF